MNHFKKYIGVYLLGLVILAIYFDTPHDDIPQIVWWFTAGAILFKTPPFNWLDRILERYTRFLIWIMGPFLTWMQSWPHWVRVLFSIAVFYLFEQYLLRPLGYTILPWRMDFG